ncbi:DMT family transporter [Telmatospirillum sp. J64-1]|uniref:DMT family transporter n=1 Tax=Telmatospirillum sp. J64-1 TaxID=2502183 RepID=UPI00115F6198|nr:DMT family transporter [Telmatospirillum sp. J64-1]
MMQRDHILRASPAGPSTSLRAFLAPALLFCLLWSSAFIAGKAGLASAPPLLLLAARFLIAGLLMVLAVSLLGLRPPQGNAGRNAWAIVLLLGLLNNALYLGMSFTALQSLPAGFVVVIVSTAPILTAILAHFLLGETLNARRITGLALGIIGVWMIVQTRLGDGGAPEIPGLVLVGLSALSLAFGTIAYKRYATGLPLLWVNAWSTLAGGLVLLPLTLAWEDLSAVTWDLTLAAALGHLVLAVSVGAMLLWFWLIRFVGAGKASSIHFLNPVFGLLLAWLVLGEIPAWNEMLGVIPVSLGVLLVVSAGRGSVTRR